MPSIRSVDADEAQQRLRGRTHREPPHAPFRAVLADLADDGVVEVPPEAGESLHTLKLRVSRAAREVGRRVAYGVTGRGALMVWLERPKNRPGRLRGRAVP